MQRVQDGLCYSDGLHGVLGCLHSVKHDEVGFLRQAFDMCGVLLSEDSLKGKGSTKGSTPQTPSKPILSPRLRLEKKNFYTGTIPRPDSYYERRLLQEMMQASYIRFQIYNFNDSYNPQRPVDGAETNRATLQQLLSISYYYAPQFFDAVKDQNLTNLRQIGFEEDQIQAPEEVLKKEKMMELYIILPEKALDMWLQRGCLPGSFIENGTDDKHAWYNFHTEIEYTINDFINIYFPQQGQQVKQPHYLTVVHTTERLLRVLSEDLRESQNRTGKWFQRKTLDHQYQTQGDRNGREGHKAINIDKYMEIDQDDLSTRNTRSNRG
eukprot:6472133-Amphidinium_carterae.2